MALRCGYLQGRHYRDATEHGVEPTCRPIDALYRSGVGLLSNDRDSCDSLRHERYCRWQAKLAVSADEHLLLSSE
jgi:hypothetical protein